MPDETDILDEMMDAAPAAAPKPAVSAPAEVKAQAVLKPVVRQEVKKPQATTVAAPVPAPAPTPVAPAPVAAPAAVKTEEPAWLRSFRLPVSDTTRSMLDRVVRVGTEKTVPLAAVVDYCARMRPAAGTHDDEAVRAQVSLYRAIETIMRDTSEAYPYMLASLLSIINEHRGDDGAFAFHYIFRQMENVPLNATERKVFYELITFFINASGATNREELKRQARPYFTSAQVARVAKAFGDDSITRLRGFFEN